MDILNYRVEGNSVLPRAAVEEAVMPFLGPQRTIDDVESARAALEKAYREAGYETVAVEIPEQDVQRGIVRLNVVELRVGRLRVTDADWYSPERIKRQVPSLAEGQVPNYREVAAEIAAVNRSQDRTITPSLRAGDTPGTVDVDLAVDDRLPLHATVELNDRTSARTDRLRVSGSVRYANLFQRDHSASLQAQFAPEDPGKSWIASASYVAPLPGSNWTLVGYGVHSKSDVNAVGGINVLGSGDIVGVRALHTTAAGNLFHTWTAGLDYKSFKEDLVLGSDTAATPIDYVPGTLGYSLGYRGQRHTVDAGLSWVFGLRGLDSSNEEFAAKRYGAKAMWSYLRGDVDWRYRLDSDGELSAKLAGQLTGQELISNEQFSAGGLDSVRTYYESFELGDSGVTAQLQYTTPALLGGRDEDHELRLLGFVDGGRTWIRNPLPDLQGNRKTGASLLGAGIGLNLRAFRHANLQLLIGKPFEQADSTLTDWDGLRGQFRLWAEF